MDTLTVKGLRWAMAFGVGVGLLMASVLTASFPQVRLLTNAEIVERARGLGMAPLTEMPRSDPNRTAVATAAPAVRPLLTVVLQSEITVAEAAVLLRDAGAISDPEAFVRQAEEKGLIHPLEAGLYTLSIGDTAEQIVEKLKKHPPSP